MRVVVMQFMTLDGVTQAPGAPDEDTTGREAAGRVRVGGAGPLRHAVERHELHHHHAHRRLLVVRPER